MNRKQQFRLFSITLLLSMATQQLFSQSAARVWKQAPRQLEAGETLNITLPQPYDCFVVRLRSTPSLPYILLNGDTLRSDPHNVDSFFQTLPQFNTEARLIIPQKASLTLFFLHAGSADIKRSVPRNNMPVTVPQSVWRAGLNPPKPGPVSTPTEHTIVHHSAGNTNETDYVKVVRSYYLLHTEVNGWDDIGYNYLIASDGTIFAGRDPQGVSGVRQDNVRGAHFCGKNNLTMGVCLIGDYTNAQPPFPAVNSLCRLLAWKLEQDGLNPFGANRHPDNNGDLLGTIAGHRDGCSTECPGNLVYAQADAIRECVALRLSGLDALDAADEHFRLQQENSFLNIVSTGFLHFDAAIYGTDGRLLASGNTKQGVLRLPKPGSGIGILYLRSEKGIYFRKVVWEE